MNHELWRRDPIKPAKFVEGGRRRGLPVTTFIREVPTVQRGGRFRRVGPVQPKSPRDIGGLFPSVPKTFFECRVSQEGGLIDLDL